MSKDIDVTLHVLADDRETVFVDAMIPDDVLLEDVIAELCDQLSLPRTDSNGSTIEWRLDINETGRTLSAQSTLSSEGITDSQDLVLLRSSLPTGWQGKSTVSKGEQRNTYVSKGKEYEAYVSGIVSSLSICQQGRGKVFRNQRYSGLRQPGSYEIDVSCELEIDDVLSVLIIVECKDWKEKIGREHIQKFIQTRDAIAANIAIFVSPIGYTKEAVAVAKAHRIALWIVAESGEIHTLAGGALFAWLVSERLSTNLLRIVSNEFGWRDNTTLSACRDNETVLVPYRWIDRHDVKSTTDGKYIVTFYHSFFSGQRNPALAEVLDYLFRNLDQPGYLCTKLRETVNTYRSILKESGMSDSLTERFLNEIIQTTITDDQIFGSVKELISFDKSLKHSKTKLLAPIKWVGRHTMLSIAESSPYTSVSNNVIWANTLWLLYLHEMS